MKYLESITSKKIYKNSTLFSSNKKIMRITEHYFKHTRSFIDSALHILMMTCWNQNLLSCLKVNSMNIVERKILVMLSMITLNFQRNVYRSFIFVHKVLIPIIYSKILRQKLIYQ